GQGGEAVGGVAEGDAEGGLGHRAGCAADALVPDDEVAGDAAVLGLQLEHQVAVDQLLAEFGVAAAGAGQQTTEQPEEQAEFHSDTSRVTQGSRNSSAMAAPREHPPGRRAQLIASRSALPGLKDTVLQARIFTGSPVCGFLPMRAPRWRCRKVPKP